MKLLKVGNIKMNDYNTWMVIVRSKEEKLGWSSTIRD